MVHLNCTGPTTSCNVGTGKPITGGVIDVPAAHIRVGGAVTARRLVLGLGHRRTVTLRPPETPPPPTSRQATFPWTTSPTSGHSRDPVLRRREGPRPPDHRIRHLRAHQTGRRGARAVEQGRARRGRPSRFPRRDHRNRLRPRQGRHHGSRSRDTGHRGPRRPHQSRRHLPARNGLSPSISGYDDLAMLGSRCSDR